MKLEDLDLRELLSFDPEGGAINLLGERALLFNAFALGQLRKELIDTVGEFAARGILTRFGYANGWRTAMNIQQNMPETWRELKGFAGAKFHSLTGMNRVVHNVRRDGGGSEPLIESTWSDCYEAEQHLLHIGRAEGPVCWAEAAFASGYVSYVEGREVYFIEDACCGKGDAVCHVTARYREDWGAQIEPYLAYYRADSGPALLKELSDKLHRTETRLKKRQRQLAFLEADDEASRLVAARSETMRTTVEIARRAARVDSSVLVTGESGVGKECMARFIHDQSTRATRPFVAVNCGALTETLLESELFGHAKGSFTGADRDRAGLFEAAAGGTLFLDEIGEVSPAMQVKLLRALQEREVRRVGENKSRPVNVRIVAATNRNLAGEIAAGRFRQDLYYRLRVIELQVPPLRERHEDILPLARFFLNRHAHHAPRAITGFTPAAAGHLLRYGWPGNVRELQNAVEYAVAMCQESRIDAGDLPCELQVLSLKPVLDKECIRPLEEIERDYILGVLHVVGDNKAQAAAELNIGPATLYRKLKEYGIRDAADSPARLVRSAGSGT
ncbi:sigma-54-dependent Fis family transcriptional regulator [Geobacter sp. FeAm09]|uniref:sigma-54-dependent Fis family transcriptional regulator n=1 Tax=Geobacter sp. FeAm09 TaxID=2597769 RepID=UPI0011EF190A|nr:sigma-54-dependent Fis family transcriptional regulator [Geobacter sp. FeAm09]QEM67564.1 sigma-54-dependent Fis family transcriptional regulator [Geobacter sp. FeAm09]